MNGIERCLNEIDTLKTDVLENLDVIGNNVKLIDGFKEPNENNEVSRSRIDPSNMTIMNDNDVTKLTGKSPGRCVRDINNNSPYKAPRLLGKDAVSIQGGMTNMTNKSQSSNLKSRKR